MSHEGNGQWGTKIELLAERARLDTLERALKSHRMEQKERLRRIARLRAGVEQRLKELEGDPKQS